MNATDRPARAENLIRARQQPVGLKYRIRPLIYGFVVVSTGNLVLVDEPVEDGYAVDAMLGEIDGVRRSGFSL